jgi:hypothetical protein
MNIFQSYHNYGFETKMIAPQKPKFEIVYHWMEGSVMPPYHYEYSIKIQEDRTGIVTYRPDYDLDDVPVWNRYFIIPQELYSRLYDLLESGEFYAYEWKQGLEIIVGGSQEWCDGTFENHKFHIPAGLTREDAGKAGALYLLFKQLGPEEMWDDLDRMRKEYIIGYFQGQSQI